MIKVIKNGIVLTLENETIIKGDIVIEDNIIKEVVDNYTGNYDEIIDAEGNVVMPGLINCHTHLGMYNLRNTNDDFKLMDWLNNKIWPIEKDMTEEDIKDATYLSCIEMIKTGTTCCADHYDASSNILKSIKNSKIRCLYTRFLMDEDGKAEERFNEFKRLYELEKDKNDLITFSLGLHSLYSSSMEYIKKCSIYAKENNLPIHMHYMENEEEYNKVPKDAINLLLDNKLILAHGIYIDNIEIFKNKDVSIVHNPISNLALGCGFADIVKFKKNNINVSIGTDGVGSGYTLNMFKHLPFAYLLPKGLYKDPTVIKALDILRMATINGAKALGINNLGLIKENYKADLIIIKLIEKPINNYFVGLLTNDLEVLTTIVNGEVLMLNKELKI
ncbi:MAG: amidohydrolase [Bacilli bacterium]